MYAALAGSKRVQGIDISEAAIANAKVNSAYNEISNIRFDVGDVFEKLPQLEDSGEKFDVVILDPPSLSRNRKTVATALKGYKEINSGALKLIENGGILATASCSHHVTEESFLEVVETSARVARRSLQLLELRGASPDHPTLSAMPETKYLKFAIFAVT